MRKYVAILIVIFLISACVGGKTSPEAPKGAAGEKTTITQKTEEGEAKVTVTTGKEEGGWCNEGASWSYSGPQGAASFIIKGKTTYNGKEVCEAEYIDKTDNKKMIVYFNEDQSYMHMVISDLTSGQKLMEYDMTQ